MRFIDALLDSPTPVIAELKRRDADGHDLFADRGVDELVDGYAAAGFPCLSVVTGSWFGGAPQLLDQVARRADRPILVKDFIVGDRQLAWASGHGASAVLLTAGLLAGPTLRGLIGRALDRGLTPFVEVTTEAECAATGPAEHCVIAVNTKDIRRRERGAPDLGRPARLLPAVLATGTRCPVVASGIADPAAGAALLAAGYRGLLVGASLLRSARLDDWAATGRPRPAAAHREQR